MYYRIVRKDISNSKMITLTTVLFVTAAAMLVSLAAILVINLTGAIDTLMMRAKTPHFMQMHTGEIDTERLGAFAEQNGNVRQFQVLEFLNVEGSSIVINGNSLGGSVQDNGFSTQSRQFDYLLDLNGNVIQASDGELYVPLCYKKDGTARIGDQAIIFGKSFTVAGFLRDSQMNSLLASSKRFLVSSHDYAEIRDLGNREYLIEFRLKDMSGLSAFETAYISAGLEANGPILTYPLFKMLNAISDGIMIGVLLLISVLVVAIAFLCIRFTLLAKIEDDYREIGVMKAIGLRVSDIKKIYLAKYMVIGAAGCILGLLLSFLFRDMLLENIRLSMGESENASTALLFGILGVLLIFLSITFYVNGVLNRFRKISATQAVRFGAPMEKPAGTGHIYLSRNKLFDINIFLGIKDVLTRKRLYVTMHIVLVLSVFIIMVPQNLYNTISAESFSTYMGIGKCDLRFDLQQTGNIAGKAAEIAKTLEQDGSVLRYTVLTTKTFQVKSDNGLSERIKIELGNHRVFPLQYSKGRAPASENEIALSALNAAELGKQVGDTMTLVVSGKEKNLTVCGIYSDITNGGKTAKAAFTDDTADIMWSVIYTELSDKSLAAEKAYEYGNKFEFAKVSDINEFINQTFGSTRSSIGKISNAALAVALLLTVLITLLFMKMLVAKERYSIAAMKALGFTKQDITLQYISRSVFILITGLILGILLANTLGGWLAGLVISQLGASSFHFTINPLSAYLINPFIMACTVLIATRIGTAGTGQIRISENIKE